MTLAASPLCVVEFDVADGIMPFGASPFGESRVGYIGGGRFSGARLNGTVLPGGGNWSRTGRLGGDASVGTFDARSVWRTDDGALIQLSYTGRSVVPDAVRTAFADPAAPPVNRALYYLRIAIVFETASPDYAWLNGIVAIGSGERLPGGVRHTIHAID